MNRRTYRSAEDAAVFCGVGIGMDHRRADIQGLRALAVVAVITFHAGLPVPGGFVGVDIFFVISGFVITGMLIRERVVNGRVSLRRFYWRRFKRLTPAMSLMLVVCLGVAIPVLSPFGAQQTAAETAVGAVFLLANLVIARGIGDYFGGPAEGNLFLNTWSLSVEEQFYLIFPTVLVICWIVARNGRWRLAMTVSTVAVMALGSFGLAVLGATGYSLERYFWLLGFFSPLTRIWEFAAGALLAVVPWRRVPHALGVRLNVFGGGLVLASLWLISSSTPFPGVWTLLPVLGTALVIAGGSVDPRAPVARLLAARPFTAVGDRSYSLYLWHWPFIVLAAAIWGRSVVVLAAAAVVSIAPALAAYGLVERPIHAAEISRWSLRLLASGVFIGGPLLLSWVVLQGSQSLWGADIPEERVFGTSSAGLNSCMRFVRSVDNSQFVDPVCQLAGLQGSRPVYLVGDSQAGQWFEAVRESARIAGSRMVLAVAPGCPFIDVHTGSAAGSGPADRACRETYEANLQLLRDAPPGDVVIAESLSYWIDPLVEVAPTAEDVGRSENWHALEAGLRSTVSVLEDAGHRVILIIPTLQLSEPGGNLMPADCSTWMLFRGECFTPTPTSEIDTMQFEARGAVRALAEEMDVDWVDLVEEQCPESSCGLWVGQVPIYADNSHVSADFGLLVAPRFKMVLLGAQQH